MIRYCGHAVSRRFDGALECGICARSEAVRFDTRRAFTNHMYVKHAATLAGIEITADAYFWTSGAPLWSWPAGVAA